MGLRENEEAPVPGGARGLLVASGAWLVEADARKDDAPDLEGVLGQHHREA